MLVLRPAGEKRANSVRDVFGFRVGHAGPDGQAKQLRRQTFGDGELPAPPPESFERRLEMDRRRIPRHRVDAERGQMREQLVAMRRPDLEQVVRVHFSGIDPLPRDRKTGEEISVPRSDVVARRDPIIEPAELVTKDPRLNCVELAVHTQEHVFVLPRLAEIALDPQCAIESLVIGDDGTAVAGCGEVLARVETEAAELADRADSVATERRAVCLSSVLDDVYGAIARDVEQGPHPRRLAEQVDGDDDTRPGRDRRGDLIDVDEIRRFVGVDEYRRRTGVDDGGNRSVEGVGVRNDFVARPYA
jgi:hypothetical protein